MKTSLQNLSMPCPLSRQRGLSLVELMVAITIGLVLLAGITALIVQQNGTRSELDRTTRQIENGRYAMQILQDEIQHAGYYGEFSKLDGPPASMPSPCVTTASALDAAMPLYIQGYDSPATVPSELASCLPDANHVAGTDILVVRRADTTAIAPAGALTWQPYLQTTLAGHVLRIGPSADYVLLKKDGVTPADLRKYLVNIYFISPCSVATGAGTPAVCTGNDDTIPTLKRLELTAAGGATTFNTVPLVEGIENLQFDYGIDTTGDGSPDGYTTSPTTTADWVNVMTMRINLLARSSEATPGYQSNKTYNLGAAGTVGPYNDKFKRHVFSEVVRLINPSGRREQ